jgi:hypothetical protein
MIMGFSGYHTLSVLGLTALRTSRLLSQRLTGRNSVNLDYGGSTFFRNFAVNLRTCMVAKLRNDYHML